MQAKPNRWARLYDILPADSFSRQDEQEDGLFYARPRLLPHLDSRALATVERVIGALIVEERSHILDLMASFDSHIPESVQAAGVVGLGLNAEELERNEALTEHIVHDLNQDPTLPFEEGQFDVVLNTVSVDYLTRPIEVFREVGRVLRPGGLHLVLFSNRMFPTKVVKIWETSSEAERIWLVEDFFQAAGLFERPQVFSSQGHARPADDPYAEHGIPSDPVFAVYAERLGGAAVQPEARPPHPRQHAGVLLHAFASQVMPARPVGRVVLRPPGQGTGRRAGVARDAAQLVGHFRRHGRRDRGGGAGRDGPAGPRVARGRQGRGPARAGAGQGAYLICLGSRVGGLSRRGRGRASLGVG